MVNALAATPPPPQTKRILELDLLKKQCDIFNMRALQKDPSQSQRILQRVAKKGRGWAFTPHDFSDLGDPRGVGMTLTRLVRDGKIAVSLVVSTMTCTRTRFWGQAGASSDSVVAAVARGRHLRLLPSPQMAANQLGLSTQVPARLIYQSDGAPATLSLGKRQIVFRRNTGRNLALAGRASGLVAQALRDLGKGNVTPDTISHLRRRLDANARKQLVADIALVPAWMRPIFTEITRDDA